MTDKKIDFHKAGAILLKDRKFLVTHELGKKFYIAPGGIVEDGETPEEAVIRELKEEVNVVAKLSDLAFFGTFYAPAAGAEDRYLQMDVYHVKAWEGEPTPASGEEVIDDLLWINSTNIPDTVKIGSIFEHEVLPKLKDLNLID